MESSSSSNRKNLVDASSGGFSSGFRKYRSRGGSSSRESVLPHNSKVRLYGLFKELEKEFESLYLENISLRDKITDLEKAYEGGGGGAAIDEKIEEQPDGFDKNNVLKSFTKNTAHKTRTKFKAHTSKIVSSFKTSSVSCSLVKEYKGHRDGVWDIDVSKLGLPLIATASADKTARIWGIDSGKCLINYTGHTGSVNAISFHPLKHDFVLTASGDGTAHIWRGSDPTASTAASTAAAAASILPNFYNQQQSSDDSGESSGTEEPANKEKLMTKRKSPVIVLSGHNGVVIGCSWFFDDQAVTASWDRTANLYDVTSGTLVQTLSGHDDQLNHVACHPSQRLVATSSSDSTFRLWDFREAIHSVSVFQGHTDSVTCAAFSRSEQIVSGSDDRCVKVWDLRNMRAPVISIQTASPVNRLSISSTGIVAIPHDNRHIVLYDLNASGQKLLRLPRENGKSHHRMVTAACWTDFSDSWKIKANLFTAGFDRVALAWSVKGIINKENENSSSKNLCSVPAISGQNQSQSLGSGI